MQILKTDFFFSTSEKWMKADVATFTWKILKIKDSFQNVLKILITM